MKWPRSFGGPLASLMLLPAALAAADSQVETAALHGELRATARVDFKIIIPKTLSLNVGEAETHRQSAKISTVAIESNNHTVTLGTTLQGTRLPVADEDVATHKARGSVILNAAARKTIAQDAACAASAEGVAPDQRAPSSATRVVCTVSTP